MHQLYHLALLSVNNCLSSSQETECPLPSFDPSLQYQADLSAPTAPGLELALILPTKQDNPVQIDGNVILWLLPWENCGDDTDVNHVLKYLFLISWYVLIWVHYQRQHLQIFHPTTTLDHIFGEIANGTDNIFVVIHLIQQNILSDDDRITSMNTTKGISKTLV